MNRYWIAALYVMAGCAVTIPLKTQGNGEPLRRERCRLVLTDTVKTISVCWEEEEQKQEFCSSLPPDYSHTPILEICIDGFIFDKTVRVNAGPLCHTSHKIRAPGKS